MLQSKRKIYGKACSCLIKKRSMLNCSLIFHFFYLTSRINTSLMIGKTFIVLLNNANFLENTSLPDMYRLLQTALPENKGFVFVFIRKNCFLNLKELQSDVWERYNKKERENGFSCWSTLQMTAMPRTVPGGSRIQGMCVCLPYLCRGPRFCPS